MEAVSPNCISLDGDSEFGVAWIDEAGRIFRQSRLDRGVPL
jgi:hypothetical protein